MKIREKFCFLTGLSGSIRTDVQANMSTSLTMAIRLARLFEAHSLDQKKPTT